MAEAGKNSRRDFLWLGSAIAGAAVLQPATLGLVSPKGSPGVATVGGGSGSEEGVERHSAATRPAGANREARLRDRELDPLPKTLPRSTAQRPNIILIVLDTVRADHLSCYGYHRETTPNIDAFAAGGRLYQNAVSPAAWTLPGHASLFTGLMPSVHGTDITHRSLDGKFKTLAEHLAENGYQTVGLSSNNAFVTPREGFERGFQTFWNPSNREVAQARWVAGLMQQQLAQWLAKRYDPSKPFFLFMNYIEAHAPYLAPATSLQVASRAVWEEAAQRWAADPTGLLDLEFEHMLTMDDLLSSRQIADLEDLYDDGIRYIDGKVGNVLACLKATGLDDNAAVFITADHGEHFNEHHLLSHSLSVYQPLVHVPLLARYQDRFSIGKEGKVVQSHDLYPTILELAGVEDKLTAGHTCQSLLQPLSHTRFAISEYLFPPLSQLGRVAGKYPDVDVSPYTRQLRAIRRDNLKLVQRTSGENELYDLAVDPMETRNLAHEKLDAARELDRTLDNWLASIDRYVARPARRHQHSVGNFRDAVNAMRGLGYVE